MAYSTKKLVEVGAKKLWKVEVKEFVNGEETHLDHDFVFGYCYQNEDGRVFHRAFSISALGSVDDKDCFVRRETKGIYYIRWKGMDQNKYQVVTTVRDL